MNMNNWSEILVRLSLAALFGAIIGLERERKNWAAGLRTHMLVCVSSALTMIVSAYGFRDILGTANIVLDPSRIAAQVISGIGFIGAGTILFLKQGVIKGLTTAAGLWTVAAIGLATGSGMYFAASAATTLALVILLILQPIERKFSDRFKQKSLRITTTIENNPVEIITTFFENRDLKISSCSIEKTDNACVIFFQFRNINPGNLTAIAKKLQTDPGIREVTWTN